MGKINYLGKGMVTCPECGGEKEVKCEVCNGYGEHCDCPECNSTGKAECPKCDGSGKAISSICPVCNKGKVRKTRWINCSRCHGKGEYYDDYREKWVSCERCGGRGQVEETYYEICPNCHGEYKRKSDKPCKKCSGTGKVKCSRCDGTGHAKCQTCSGSGKVKCAKCGGEGSIFDSTISLKTMQEAAADGNLDALHELAYAYILGTDGLSVNYEKAKECFEKILRHEADDEWDEVAIDCAEVYLRFCPGSAMVTLIQCVNWQIHLVNGRLVRVLRGAILANSG